ncbi:MAG: hypothetical protein LBT52_04705 [Clostridiales Family XIII bacterium]|jgi:hypothetical protein|nr:hypothetical protein [Clostridiales Family XIII bacterium]
MKKNIIDLFRENAKIMKYIHFHEDDVEFYYYLDIRDSLLDLKDMWGISDTSSGETRPPSLKFANAKLAFMALYIIAKMIGDNDMGDDLHVPPEINALDAGGIDCIAQFETFMDSVMDRKYFSLHEECQRKMRLIENDSNYDIIYHTIDGDAYYLGDNFDQERAFLVYYHMCNDFRYFDEAIVPLIRPLLRSEQEFDLMVLVYFEKFICKIHTKDNLLYKEADGNYGDYTLNQEAAIGLHGTNRKQLIEECGFTKNPYSGDSSTSYDRAKRIYLEHRCNLFFIWLEGKTRKYHATHEANWIYEWKWDEEYANKQIEEIAGMDVNNIADTIAEFTRVTSGHRKYNALFNTLLNTIKSRFDELDEEPFFLICDALLDCVEVAKHNSEGIRRHVTGLNKVKKMVHQKNSYIMMDIHNQEKSKDSEAASKRSSRIEKLKCIESRVEELKRNRWRMSGK